MFNSVKAMGLSIILSIGGEANAAFFDDAKAGCQDVLERIKKHPFIVELAKGTLRTDRFCYYLAQDDVYLDSYAKTLSILGAKVDTALQMQIVLTLALATSESEKDSVHRHYQRTICKAAEQDRTPALFAYQNFLLALSSVQPLAVGYASTIPCDWIYREVATWLAKRASKNNPYTTWIAYYAKPGDNNDSVKMLNNLAEKTSQADRDKMLEAFRTSCLLELKFWDDAYYLRVGP